MAHEKTAEEELDEDGLVVQKYSSTVLVVLPPTGFGEQILRYARSSLYNVHVGTWSVSSLDDDVVKGRLQDEFMVDAPLAGAVMADYSGILIAGGEGECLLAREARVLELLREAARDEKLIGAWGNGLEALLRAEVVRGRRLTGPVELADAVRRAGGRYTGRETEVSGNVITARDEGAGMRFGKALAEVVRI
jgi:putative intracellular protease/amidase